MSGKIGNKAPTKQNARKMFNKEFNRDLVINDLSSAQGQVRFIEALRDFKDRYNIINLSEKLGYTQNKGSNGYKDILKVFEKYTKDNFRPNDASYSDDMETLNSKVVDLRGEDLDVMSFDKFDKLYNKPVPMGEPVKDTKPPMAKKIRGGREESKEEEEVFEMGERDKIDLDKDPPKEKPKIPLPPKKAETLDEKVEQSKKGKMLDLTEALKILGISQEEYDAEVEKQTDEGMAKLKESKEEISKSEAKDAVEALTGKKEEKEENVKMEIKQPSKRPIFNPTQSEPDPVKPLPTKSQMIPSSRLSTRSKKANELRDDIKYFLQNFPDLEREAEIFKELGSRATKTDLVKLHSRIVGKVRPMEDPKTDMKGRRVGVVLDGEQYIRSLVNDMLTESRMKNMRPADIVNVNPDKTDDPTTKDIGDFEVKQLPDGGFASKREAIYRFIPSENEERVNKSNKKYKRFEIGKSGDGRRMNNLRTNAKLQFKEDPFNKRQPVKRLNYLF